MYLVLAVIITVLVVLISAYINNEKKFIKHLSKYPGPKPLPIIGQGLEFYNGEENFKSFYKYSREYGSLYKLKITSRYFLVSSDVQFFEFLLASTKHIEKSADYKTLMDWFGTGLLTASSEKWKTFRRIITPTFHYQILEQYVDGFNTSIDVLIKKLEKEVGKDRTDIYPYMTLYALDTICETAMGTSVNAQENPDSPYVNSVRAMGRLLVERAFSLWKQFDCLYHLSSSYRQSTRYIKILHDFSNSVIKSRKESLLKEASNSADLSGEDEFGKKKKMAFLDLLLKSTLNGEPLSDLDIRQEVDTFMFEGHDTTTSSLSFALFCLAKYQQVQEKVMGELDSIYGDDWQRQVNYKDLQEMQYLEQVIKESMRLYPAVPMTFRELQEDTEYDGGILPKGITLVIYIYGTHMNPKYFSNPEEFDPDRFLTENQSQRHFYSYIPFSAGSRNCIGQKFAMLEMKATISKILMHYEILPVVPEHHLRLSAEAILRSANGIPIRIKRRLRCYNK